MVGYEGQYAVSSLGRVFSTPATKPARLVALGAPRRAKDHWTVAIYPRGAKPRRISVHRQVALAFLGPPPSPTHHAAHNDGNKDNNTIANLRWATPTENNLDAVRHGTSRAKLTIAAVRSLREKLAAGESRRAIASAFGVSKQTVDSIAKQRTWKEIA